MRKEDPFRLSGRPGRVNQTGDLVGPRMDGLHRMKTARLLQRCHAPRPGPLHQNQVRQVRYFLRKIGYLLQNLRFGDEQNLDRAVGDDVLPDPGKFRFVHRNETAAEAVGGIGGNRPFRPVVRDDPDRVAPADPQARQAGAKLVHPPAELPVGQPFVHALRIFRSEQRAVRTSRQAVLQKFDQIVRFIHCCHRRSSSARNGIVSSICILSRELPRISATEPKPPLRRHSRWRRPPGG